MKQRNKFKHGDIIEICATSYVCCIDGDDVLLGHVWDVLSSDDEQNKYGESGYLIVPLVVGYIQEIPFKLSDNYIPEKEELMFIAEEYCYEPNEKKFAFDKQVVVTDNLKWKSRDWGYTNDGAVFFI